MVAPRFRIDLHVHTARHSPCAESLPPGEVARSAASAGLRGAVLSEHDVLWDATELAALDAASAEVKLYRGLECSASGAHLLMIGLASSAGLHRRMPFDEAVAAAHDQGAVVVLAHPHRYGDPTRLPLHLVDAIEVASSSITPSDTARALRLARRLDKATVGGSDAHTASVVGCCCTEFHELPVDETHLASLIRARAGRWRRRNGRERCSHS